MNESVRIRPIPSRRSPLEHSCLSLLARRWYHCPLPTALATAHRNPQHNRTPPQTTEPRPRRSTWGLIVPEAIRLQVHNAEPPSTVTFFGDRKAIQTARDLGPQDLLHRRHLRVPFAQQPVHSLAPVDVLKVRQILQLRVGLAVLSSGECT